MSFAAGIKSIIFDMDGVLWESSPIHAAAYRAVLEQAGLEMPDYQLIAGRRTNEVMSELLAAQRPSKSLDNLAAVTALTKAKQEAARQLLRSQPPLTPGCAEVVRELARRTRLTLASSASAETVALFLDCSGTRDCFDVLVSGDEVAISKPHPAIYQLALQKLGCAGIETVVVEDAPAGVRAALDAGISTVITIEGTASRERLVAAGAHCVITNLRELVA